MALFLKQKIVSIDFGSQELKVVEGKYTKNNINILKSFKLKLPNHTYSNGNILNKDIIIQCLKDSLKAHKIKAKSTYVVINSSQIITREVIIPNVPDNEISSLIDFQLIEFLPVDPDEYVIDTLILGRIIQEQLEKLKILIIAIPKTLVISHLDLIKKIGLKPKVLDYQGNSMAKLLKYSDYINKDYNTRDIAIASIDMGHSSTKISIVKNGNMEVTRVIDAGSGLLYKNLSSFFDYSLEELERKVKNIKDITKEKEEFTNEARLINLTRNTLINIMEKIEAIFRYYTSRENSNNISLILLQGGLCNINEIDNFFSNYFNISSIILRELEKINGSEDLKTYSNAIGALIRIDEVEK